VFKVIASYLDGCPVDVMVVHGWPFKLGCKVAETSSKVAALHKVDWRWQYIVCWAIWRCGNPVLVFGWVLGYGFG